MELKDALRTTGAVREFADRRVEDEVLYRVLETARFAPSGGNRQAWRVVVLKDPAGRARIRDLYLHGWYQYVAMTQAGLVPWAPVTDEAKEAAAREAAAEIADQAATTPGGFAEHFDETPALLLLLADLRALAAVDRDLDRYTLVGGASIYPFAWSILLAAHDEGLGGVITTMVVQQESEALKQLGAPDGWALAAVIALGYPREGRATRLRRGAVEKFAVVDRFDGPPLEKPAS